ncbi:unnamed protein product [Chrysoparadoxa australica]
MKRLDCAIQRYRWGKKGASSRVAQLKKREDEGFEVNEEEPYAELWMGTHPNGPSKISPCDDLDHDGLGVFLIEHLETNPRNLGDLREVGDLPFMFKILSINQALSIQAHPDKPLAERLYATRPDIYKDDNHKPEMAIALSDFEGLCGFRPFHEIVYNLYRYPELRGVVSLRAVKAVLDVPQDIGAQQSALGKLFISYMKASPNVVSTQVSALVARLQGDSELHEGGDVDDAASIGSTDDEGLDLEEIYGANYSDTAAANQMLTKMRGEEQAVRKLMLRLSREYPGDIGILMPLLLNYLRLGKGESFFMAANEPHAYLRGDLMEVMARSDNVIRVALTHKYRDVPLLCETLSYKMGQPPIVKPRRVDAYCQRFTPPVPDFELQEIKLPASSHYPVPAITVPMVMLVLEGEGSANDGQREVKLWPVCMGVVYFLPASVRLELHCDEDSPCSLRIAITHTNIHYVPRTVV